MCLIDGQHWLSKFHWNSEKYTKTVFFNYITIFIFHFLLVFFKKSQQIIIFWDVMLTYLNQRIRRNINAKHS